MEDEEEGTHKEGGKEEGGKGRDKGRDKWGGKEEGKHKEILPLSRSMDSTFTNRRCPIVKDSYIKE